MRRTLAILASTAVAMSTVALAAPARAAENIPSGGASFPYVFISQCAADFNASQNNFTIQYTSTGSGTGKGNFAKGTFVTAMSDSAYTSGEPTWSWEYIPAIGGAITVPINLKNAKTGRTLGSSIQLKQTTLAKIFGGAITTWNHPEIKKDNPRIATALPATPITISYRSDSSGTTNNFLQYLNAWAPSIFGKVQDDMSTAFPGGKPPSNSVAGRGNSGVMANVLAKEGTIGYVDLGDAKGYPSARIQNAKGEFIAPSAASAAKNLANQTNVAANGLVQLNYKNAVSGAYPIAIFSYALARTDGKGPNGLGVRQFWDYVLAKCGPSRAASLGYVPVAGKVLAKARQLVQLIK
ncbi:MAG: substrate-binding domain-containing protein [Actinomycetota bacterium]|nr:substrate-binding domain-containing protein [Actinomycetota bacterium]